MRLAEAADLEALMALERRPGYEDHVGRSSRDEHEAMLASGRYVYLIGLLETQAPIAFAILRDLHDPQAGCYLKRVAVDSPGRGRGVEFLAAVIDWVFAASAAPRFHLDCFVENARAQRAYEKLGLIRGAVLRGAYEAAGGQLRDLQTMTLTRPAWRAERRAPPPEKDRRAAP